MRKSIETAFRPKIGSAWQPFRSVASLMWQHSQAVEPLVPAEAHKDGIGDGVRKHELMFLVGAFKPLISLFLISSQRVTLGAFNVRGTGSHIIIGLRLKQTFHSILS